MDTVIVVMFQHYFRFENDPEIVLKYHHDYCVQSSCYLNIKLQNDIFQFLFYSLFT